MIMDDFFCIALHGPLPTGRIDFVSVWRSECVKDVIPQTFDFCFT